MNINSYTVTAANGIATTAWGVADLFATLTHFNAEYGNATLTAR